MIFSLLSLFWKIKVGLWDHLAFFINCWDKTFILLESLHQSSWNSTCTYIMPLETIFNKSLSSLQPLRFSYQILSLRWTERRPLILHRNSFLISDKVTCYFSVSVNINYYREIWYSDKALDVHERGVRFEPRPEHRIFCFFEWFSSASPGKFSIIPRLDPVWMWKLVSDNKGGR
jgi:hypothetical protein